MKLFFLIFSFVSSLASANPILGHWQSTNPIYSRDVTFYVDFEFTPTDIFMHVDCDFHDGVRLEAAVRSGAVYGLYSNKIFVLDHQQNITQDGNRFCRATLQKTQWITSYDYSGRLTLATASPYQIQFILSRN